MTNSVVDADSSMVAVRWFANIGRSDVLEVGEKAPTWAS
jgi:hypothetical protein